MDDLVASKTALATSRMRAVHTRCDPQPIIVDPWGDRLVPASMLVASFDPNNAVLSNDLAENHESELARIADDFLRSSPAYTNVITRARYTEDALCSAIARGVRQYVLIGAGFDSYALRMPPQAKDLQVFEVDHRATQALKIQRIAQCGITVGSQVHFVAADLARERLDEALSRSSFDSSEPVFFSWLGVTMYLTREANMATFRSISDYSAQGSQLAFSYTDQKLFDRPSSEAALYEELEQAVKAVGEPFVSGFHPATLSTVLGEVNLELEENLNEVQLLERYDPEGINRLTPSNRSHIALVRVSGKRE